MSQGSMKPYGSTGNKQTADKLKQRFSWLESFSDDELREINYCSSGDALDDEIYFDISHPERGVVQGYAGERAPDDTCYVARSDVPRHLWDKLVGPYL